MSRNAILVVGAISWTLAIAVAVIHLATGDPLVPALMGIAFAAWMTVRRRQFAQVVAQA